jgi:hypothetical protein
MMVRVSALLAGRSIPPGRFLVLISVNLSDIELLEEICKLKNPSELSEKETHDLPFCSTVPQSITIPYAPYQTIVVQFT